jgi:chromosome segregation ATPase
MKTGILWLGLGVGLGLACLAGCERQPEAGKVWQARAEKAEMELASALKAIEKARAERDEFERLSNERFEQMRKLEAEWGSAQEGLDRRQQQLDQVRQERDRAGATAKEVTRTVEGLQGQLRDKTAQIQNLERINKELQQTVQDLTLQVQQLIQVVHGPGDGSEGGHADANGT